MRPPIEINRWKVARDAGVSLTALDAYLAGQLVPPRVKARIEEVLGAPVGRPRGAA